MNNWAGLAATIGFVAITVAWWPWSLPLAIFIWWVWKTS